MLPVEPAGSGSLVVNRRAWNSPRGANAQEKRARTPSRALGRRGRRCLERSLHALRADDDGENRHRSFSAISTVVRLVHRFHEPLTLAIGLLPLGSGVDREFAVEDVAEDWNRVHMPSGLLARLERDLYGRDTCGCAGRIPDRLIGDSPGTRQNHPLSRTLFIIKDPQTHSRSRRDLCVASRLVLFRSNGRHREQSDNEGRADQGACHKLHHSLRNGVSECGNDGNHLLPTAARASRCRLPILWLDCATSDIAKCYACAIADDNACNRTGWEAPT